MMMTPNMLERATQGFRRGYRDTWNDALATNPYINGTFAAYDWNEGADAARAEMRYDDNRFNKRERIVMPDESSGTHIDTFEEPDPNAPMSALRKFLES